MISFYVVFIFLSVFFILFRYIFSIVFFTAKDAGHIGGDLVGFFPINDDSIGIYALDVLEHIPREKEDLFIRNALASLKDDGALIFGMPSLESQTYASPPSKAGHVNCKSAADFQQLMKKYFSQVFIFSMNDEVLHTGFYAMSHYVFTLCCGKK